MTAVTLSNPLAPLQLPSWGTERREESRTQPLVLSAVINTICFYIYPALQKSACTQTLLCRQGFCLTGYSGKCDCRPLCWCWGQGTLLVTLLGTASATPAAAHGLGVSREALSTWGGRHGGCQRGWRSRTLYESPAPSQRKIPCSEICDSGKQ